MMQFIADRPPAAWSLPMELCSNLLRAQPYARRAHRA